MKQIIKMIPRLLADNLIFVIAFAVVMFLLLGEVENRWSLILFVAGLVVADIVAELVKKKIHKTGRGTTESE